MCIAIILLRKKSLFIFLTSFDAFLFPFVILSWRKSSDKYICHFQLIFKIAQLWRNACSLLKISSTHCDGYNLGLLHLKNEWFHLHIVYIFVPYKYIWECYKSFEPNILNKMIAGKENFIFQQMLLLQVLLTLVHFQELYSSPSNTQWTNVWLLHMKKRSHGKQFT